MGFGWLSGLWVVEWVLSELDSLGFGGLRG